MEPTAENALANATKTLAYFGAIARAPARMIKFLTPPVDDGDRTRTTNNLIFVKLPRPQSGLMTVKMLLLIYDFVVYWYIVLGDLHLQTNLVHPPERG